MTLLQVSIDYKIPLWAIIVYILGQVAAVYWFIDRLSKSTENNKLKIEQLEKELIELRLIHKTEMAVLKEIGKEQNKEVRELREKIIEMKAVIDLKILSEMKTGRKAA